MLSTKLNLKIEICIPNSIVKVAPTNAMLSVLKQGTFFLYFKVDYENNWFYTMEKIKYINLNQKPVLTLSTNMNGKN